MELVRRARALRLHKEILGDQQKSKDLELLIQEIETQDSHIEGLRRLEILLKSEDPKKTNVIPFQNKSRQSISKKKLKLIDKRFVLETPCLIEGADALERKKLALEIHSRTNRNVFIDVDATRNFLCGNLDHLEDCTLYISKIEDLNRNEGKHLEKLLEQPHRALVISATDSSFVELRKHQELSEKLLTLASQAHFRLQRPLKEYLEMGFFKLFLESLT